MQPKFSCPGSDIHITIFDCPKCGEEVELFTGESRAKCFNCGTVVFREKADCLDYCEFAVECFGPSAIQAKKQKAEAEAKAAEAGAAEAKATE